MSQKIPDAPITRSELYDAREIELLEQIAEGGLGPSVTVEPLSVTENGTYTAPANTAYSPVTVAVPEPVLDPLEVTQNGTYTPVHDGYSEVTVNVPTGGGGSEPTRDVNFYDYDGTVLYSYSAADFLALSAMPANPTHDGLTAQGWNWSFEDAQDYVSKYGMLEIGQMYITDDGKTRIYIHLEEGRLSPTLGIAINGTVVLDWGDGSQQETVSGTSNAVTKFTTHDYSAPGEYEITIEVTSGYFVFSSNSDASYLLCKSGSETNQTASAVYRNTIRKINIGSGARITLRSFSRLSGLSYITIPNSVEYISSQGGSFEYCCALKHLSLPGTWAGEGVSNVSQLSMESVSIGNGADPVNLFNYSGARLVRRITVPEGKYIRRASVYGDLITTFHVPETVESIANPSMQLPGLKRLYFHSETPPALQSSSSIAYLPTDCIIYVPAGTLSAYTSATNYPSSSTYTYVEY